MSDCGLPPGIGVGPSIFPTKKVYFDYDVTYTEIDGDNYVTQAIYYDSNALEITRIDLTYSPSYNPIWLGHELKGHSFNVFTASFELIPPTTTPSPPILDIDIDNQTIYEGAAVGTLLGILSITGGTPPESYQIVSQDVDTLFDLNGTGDSLVINEDLLGHATSTYNITIRAVDAAAEEYEKIFEIDITPYTSDYSTIFDGISEYCTAPTNAAWQTDDRSVSLWFKTDGVAATSSIASKTRSGGGGLRSEWNIQMFTDGKVAVTISQTVSGQKQYQYSAALNLDDGAWHNIVWTYEKLGDTLTIYSDGVVATPIKAADNPMPSGIQASDTDLLIGAGFNSGGSIIALFDGNVDELGFWSSALNASEVLDLYNTGAPKSLLQQTYTPDLVSWWRMGELDTAPTITDIQIIDDLTMVNMDQSNFVLDTP